MKVVEKKDFDQTINLPQKTIVTDGELIKRENFFIQSLQDGSKFNIANKKNIQNNRNVNISEIPMPISEKITPTNIINKVLKDVIARYSILKGNYVNHNLGFFHTDEMLKKEPEENQQESNDENNNNKNEKKSIKLKKDNKSNMPDFSHVKKEIGIVEKNKINLEKNIRNQIYEISNLGTMINYSKHSYSTLKLNISNEMLEKFGTLYENGSIYSEKRPVPWCTNCGKSATPKDIKYRKSKIKNTYFLCKIKNDDNKLEKLGDLKNISLVCSTIRPWILLHSSKLIIAKNTKFSLVEVEDVKKNINRYIIGSEFVKHVMEDAFFIKYRIVEEFDSQLLEDIILFNPIKDDKELKIYSVDKKFVHIDNRNMTGINLLGNADSYLDYLVNKELNITKNLNCVIDAKGNFNNFISDYKGQNYKDVNEKIISLLSQKHMLFLDINTVIIIPRCKECNHEITYRYLNKWYIKRKDDIKEDLKNSFDLLLKRITYNEGNKLSSIEKGLNKILERQELAISNERKSSVPIPAFYCASCGDEIISPLTINICKKILNEKGIDTWNKMTPEEILGGQVKCHKCDCDFLFKEDSSLNDSFKLLTIPMFNVKVENKIEKDDKDGNVNFEENSNAIIKNLCIETRNDFLKKIRVLSFDNDAINKINSINQVMLHTKVKENVKTIATPLFFGKTDNDFSSNLITTDLGIIDIVKKYGIDVLRLWAIYRSDNPSIKLTEGDIINVRNMYIQFRKTIKYILSNLYDFNPNKDSINLQERDDLDIYIYSKMQQLETLLDKHYNELNFPAIYKLLNKFCVEILQKNYFEVTKYRLYITPKDGFYRRSVQTNFYDLIGIFVTYLQPILPLLFEESWPYIFHTSPAEERNILLFRDTKDLEKIELNEEQKIWHKIFTLRKKIIPLVNKACNDGIIKTALEARVIITCSEEEAKFIKDNYYNIIRTLNVSVIVFRLGDKLNIEIKKALGVECTKCKNYSTAIGINYKYRHLCKQCADIEDSIATNTVPKKKPPKEVYIEEEHRNDDDDYNTKDDIDLPPPPLQEVLDLNVDFDDRLGDKMDEEKIRKIKEMNLNSMKQEDNKNNNETSNDEKTKEVPQEEKYHFENNFIENIDNTSNATTANNSEIKDEKPNIDSSKDMHKVENTTNEINSSTNTKIENSIAPNENVENNTKNDYSNNNERTTNFNHADGRNTSSNYSNVQENIQEVKPNIENIKNEHVETSSKINSTYTANNDNKPNIDTNTSETNNTTNNNVSEDNNQSTNDTNNTTQIETTSQEKEASKQNDYHEENPTKNENPTISNTDTNQSNENNGNLSVFEDSFRD